MIGVFGRVDSDPINVRGGRLLFKFPSGGADLFFSFLFPFFLPSNHFISSHLISSRLSDSADFLLLYFPYFISTTTVTLSLDTSSPDPFYGSLDSAYVHIHRYLNNSY